MPRVTRRRKKWIKNVRVVPKKPPPPCFPTRPPPPDDLWTPGPKGSSLRCYKCPTCGLGTFEDFLRGVPLRCEMCGGSFLVHPGLKPERPARFDEQNTWLLRRPKDPVFDDEPYFLPHDL
jgi:DNA-directed RNA polymerase subunit RPC12/RpoP